MESSQAFGLAHLWGQSDTIQSAPWRSPCC